MDEWETQPSGIDLMASPAGSVVKSHSFGDEGLGITSSACVCVCLVLWALAGTSTKQESGDKGMVTAETSTQQPSTAIESASTEPLADLEAPKAPLPEADQAPQNTMPDPTMPHTEPLANPDLEAPKHPLPDAEQPQKNTMPDSTMPLGGSHAGGSVPEQSTVDTAPTPQAALQSGCTPSHTISQSRH